MVTARWCLIPSKNKGQIVMNYSHFILSNELVMHHSYNIHGVSEVGYRLDSQPICSLGKSKACCLLSKRFVSSSWIILKYWLSYAPPCWGKNRSYDACCLSFDKTHADIAVWNTALLPSKLWFGVFMLSVMVTFSQINALSRTISTTCEISYDYHTGSKVRPIVNVTTPWRERSSRGHPRHSKSTHSSHS